jgi:N-acetylglucosamine-6-phosphate deacetylase
MLALTNCDVYSGERVYYEKAVLIRQGLVVDLVAFDEVPEGAETLDLQGATVSPGFIDLQVNGGGDCLFNDDPTPASIRTIIAAHRRFGTTDLLITLITDTDEKIRQAVDAVEECLGHREPGLLGFHLEGPFLNPEKAGVHDPALMRRMDAVDLDLLPDPKHGRVLLTVAPEVVETGLIAEIVAKGVKVSAGHSNALHGRMLQAFDEGLDCGTHLFNAMRNIESREPGVVGSVLDDGRVWAGMIVDGFHVHPSSVHVAWKANGPGRTFLVTDAMPPVGGEKSDFRIGGHSAAVVDGRCQTPKGVLAGSALDMAGAVRNMVQKVGVPKDEALRMATLNPATYLGIDDRLGLIEPGYRANLAIMDDQIHVQGVFLDGVPRWVGYKADTRT